MQIRDAVEQDLAAINAIYNQVVLSSTAIYEDTPMTTEQRLVWWHKRVALGYPVLVAEDDGIAGFGSYGAFRPHAGYRFTVEGSIHIRESGRRQGAGRRLLDALVERAREAGMRVLVAGVDAENHASLAFLKKYGFEQAGCMPGVGYKFDRFLDLVLLQYALRDGSATGEIRS